MSVDSTPSAGPWRVSTEYGKGGATVKIVCGNGAVIALVKCGGGRKLANAELLAEAPALRDENRLLKLEIERLTGLARP